MGICDTLRGKNKYRTVIIPHGVIDPHEDSVIEIPPQLKNRSVIVSKKKQTRGDPRALFYDNTYENCTQYNTATSTPRNQPTIFPSCAGSNSVCAGSNSVQVINPPSQTSSQVPPTSSQDKTATGTETATKPQIVGGIPNCCKGVQVTIQDPKKDKPAPPNSLPQKKGKDLLESDLSSIGSDDSDEKPAKKSYGHKKRRPKNEDNNDLDQAFIESKLGNDISRARPPIRSFAGADSVDQQRPMMNFLDTDQYKSYGMCTFMPPQCMPCSMGINTNQGMCYNMAMEQKQNLLPLNYRQNAQTPQGEIEQLCICTQQLASKRNDGQSTMCVNRSPMNMSPSVTQQSHLCPGLKCMLSNRTHGGSRYPGSSTYNASTAMEQRPNWISSNAQQNLETPQAEIEKLYICPQYLAKRRIDGTSAMYTDNLTKSSPRTPLQIGTSGCPYLQSQRCPVSPAVTSILFSKAQGGNNYPRRSPTSNAIHSAGPLDCCPRCRPTADNLKEALSALAKKLAELGQQKESYKKESYKKRSYKKQKTPPRQSSDSSMDILSEEDDTDQKGNKPFQIQLNSDWDYCVPTSKKEQSQPTPRSKTKKTMSTSKAAKCKSTCKSYGRQQANSEKIEKPSGHQQEADLVIPEKNKNQCKAKQPIRFTPSNSDREEDDDKDVDMNKAMIPK